MEIVIGNAAGLCKTTEGVRRFANIPGSTYVTVGSVTANQLAGNSEPREHLGLYDEFFNSIGLKNGGIPYFEKELGNMLLILRAAGKKLRISVAGFSPAEYVLLVRLAAQYADVIELNFGCPNAWKDGVQKRIVSFNLDFMNEILSLVAEALAESGGPLPHIAVKLSPYSDPGFIPEVAAVLSAHTMVSSIVLSNTFPNALPLRPDGSRAISGKGYAGMSGRPFKSIVLGQVAQFSDTLPTRITKTAVGGIWQGIDLRDYKSVGADDFQVGVECYLYGENRIPKILQEYYAL